MFDLVYLIKVCITLNKIIYYCSIIIFFKIYYLYSYRTKFILLKIYDIVSKSHIVELDTLIELLKDNNDNNKKEGKIRNEKCLNVLIMNRAL